MIVETRDWRRLLRECRPEDLQHWHEDWEQIDWPASLRQPDWHLITDGHGSWCLLHPFGVPLMGHLIISPDRRGRDGLEIARDMLAWIDVHLGRTIVATASQRKTQMFLRWLGFRQLSDDPFMLIWSPPKLSPTSPTC